MTPRRPALIDQEAELGRSLRQQLKVPLECLKPALGPSGERGERPHFDWLCHRGFVEELRFGGGEVVAREVIPLLELIATQTPIRRLQFHPIVYWTHDGALGDYNVAMHRAPLTAHTLAGLLELSLARQVRVLDLRGNDLDEGAAHVLCRDRVLAGLTELHLGPLTYEWEGVHATTRTLDNRFSKSNRAMLNARFRDVVRWETVHRRPFIPWWSGDL